MVKSERTTENEGRIVSLQVLRGIAAMLVAMAHLYPIDQRYFGGPVLSPLTQFGFAGVDLFFVLSGFVMVHLTRVGAGCPSVVPAFLFARAARIYPLWWLILGIFSAFWLVWAGWVFFSISGAPKLLADFALWPHGRAPFLAVGWTLIHEMYFYIAFAFLLLLPARYLTHGVAGWMLLVTAANFWIAMAGVSISPVLTIITHPLTLEFGFGAAVGLFATKGIRPAPFLLIGAGLCWLLAAGVFAADSPVALFESHWSRVVAVGPAWAFIVWGMVGLETDQGQIPLRALGTLGDSSYALYLIHVLVFSAGARAISPFCGAGVWDNVVSWVVLLVAAVVAAGLLHRFVERPVLKSMTQLRLKVMPKGSALLSSPPPSLNPRTV